MITRYRIIHYRLAICLVLWYRARVYIYIHIYIYIYTSTLGVPPVANVMEAEVTPSTTEQEGNPADAGQNGTTLGSSHLSQTDSGDTEPEFHSSNETSPKKTHKAKFKLTNVNGSKIRLRRLPTPTNADGADSSSPLLVAASDTRPSIDSRNTAKTSQLLYHNCPFNGCTVSCLERESMLQHIRHSHPHPSPPSESALKRPLHDYGATPTAQNALRAMTST